jgi:hypothetical protein
MDRQVRDWVREGRLPASKVAVLSTCRWDTLRCSVQGHKTLGGLPLIDDAVKWRAGDGILIATTKSFKGLEADAVILTDVSKPFRDSDVAELYVACSRAKHLLSIFAVEEL